MQNHTDKYFRQLTFKLVILILSKIHDTTLLIR